MAVNHEHHSALHMALSVAAQLHAQVAVIYVFEPASAVNAMSAYRYVDSIENQRRHALEILQRIECEIPAEAHAFTRLREGNAAREICSAADEWKPDIVVLGTHHKGAIARLLLGSTSQRVAHNVRHPVLLVDDIQFAQAISEAQ